VDDASDVAIKAFLEIGERSLPTFYPVPASKEK
jgi:hypothetical protein